MQSYASTGIAGAGAPLSGPMKMKLDIGGGKVLTGFVEDIADERVGSEKAYQASRHRMRR